MTIYTLVFHLGELMALGLQAIKPSYANGWQFLLMTIDNTAFLWEITTMHKSGTEVQKTDLSLL